MLWYDEAAIRRCSEAGVGFLDSKVDKVLEVNEGLSSVLCYGGRSIKSRCFSTRFSSSWFYQSEVFVKVALFVSRGAIGEHVLEELLKYVPYAIFG